MKTRKVHTVPRNYINVGVVLLCLGEALISEAKNTLNYDAAHLVKAMDMSNAALFAAQVPFLLEQQKKKDDAISDDKKIFFSCLKSADRSQYTDIYAEEVVKHLSAEEIQQATIFFESAAGKRQKAK